MFLQSSALRKVFASCLTLCFSGPAILEQQNTSGSYTSLEKEKQDEFLKVAMLYIGINA